jgi:heptosyltransferase-2
VEISCHPVSGALEHSNSPVRFGPYTSKKAILQPAVATPPCRTACTMAHAHCIESIPAEAVLSALRALLQRPILQGDPS